MNEEALKKAIKAKPAALFMKDRKMAVAETLIIEEPLSIEVEGKPYAVVMRTPGEEIPHAAGFALAEGLIDSPEDIGSIGFCEEDEGNVVTLTLTDRQRKKVAGLLDRKGFISQTSCGICGKQVIDDLCQVIAPIPHRHRFDPAMIMSRVEAFPDYQAIHQKTRSAHAAMLFDRNGGAIAWAEDVGRHNALDKAIGKLFLNRRLKEAVFVLMSSRLSYELVQKAARANLEMIVGISRPTALAVDLAKSVNMTLVWAGKKGQVVAFTGEERLLLP